MTTDEKAVIDKIHSALIEVGCHEEAEIYHLNIALGLMPFRVDVNKRHLYCRPSHLLMCLYDWTNNPQGSIYWSGVYCELRRVDYRHDD